MGGGFAPSAVNSAAYSITVVASYVQQCSNYATYVANRSCTLTGVTAGDTLVIGVWSSNPNLTSVTASSGTPASAVANLGTGGGYGYISTYLLSNASAGSITLTATESVNTDIWISATEYTNVTASPLDAIGSASSATTYGPANVNSSSFSTTANYDMLWSLCSGEFATWTPGTAPIAWTQLLSTVPVNSTGIFVEDGVAGAAGTYYGSATKAAAPIFRTSLPSRFCQLSQPRRSVPWLEPTLLLRR